MIYFVSWDIIWIPFVLSDCKNFSLIEKFENSSRVSVVLPQVGCEFLRFCTSTVFLGYGATLLGGWFLTLRLLDGLNLQGLKFSWRVTLEGRPPCCLTMSSTSHSRDITSQKNGDLSDWACCVSTVEAMVLLCFWDGDVIHVGCSIWLLNYSNISWRTAVPAFAKDYSTIVPISVWSNS